MTTERFISKRFNAATLEIINHADDIVEEYAAQGYVLTLRQLYYQFVARDLLANTQKNYKRLGAIISNARLAGLIDWSAIVDRTRNLKSVATWSSPREGIEALAEQYRIDMWENQPQAVEVWIEKEALVGVITDVCQKFGVPYFACKGYVSQSELWRAGKRAERRVHDGQGTTILHLGDHDPSGVDMTRDNLERLRMFSGSDVKVKRLALNFDQVEEYNPPPNPTKFTDTRAKDYIAEYGYACWELDALMPQVLNGLIENAIQDEIDYSQWDQDKNREQGHALTLQDIINGLDY